MLGLGLNSPSLFAAYPCSPSVCAEVHATARSRLEEGDVDGLVRSRFAESNKPLQPLATGSRLLRQVGEVCALTGEKDPLQAMTSIIREVKELRAIKERVLHGTGQLSIDAAMAVIEVAMNERTELRAAEDALNTTLAADGWRAVAAEVESGRHLEQRVRAFAGVASGSSSSLEAALRTLQHRERERLSLVQLRNDVLTVAGHATASTASGPSGKNKENVLPSGEPTAQAVRVVSEVVEAASSLKALAKKPTLVEAIATLRQPSDSREEVQAARKKLRRLYTQMMIASRSLPYALHRSYLGESTPPGPFPSPAAAPSAGGSTDRTDTAAASDLSPSKPSPEQADDVAIGAEAGGADAEVARSSRSERGSARSRPSARSLSADLVGGAADAGADHLVSERDLLVDGEEDTADEDDEEDAGQRAWRRTGAFLGAILGGAGEQAGPQAGAPAPAEPVGSAANAPSPAGVHVPRLPLGAGGPAAAPSAEPPAASNRSSKGKSSSARHASPRRAANAAGNNSPRGSPTAKTGASTTRPPSNALLAAKKRPPSAPAPSAPLGSTSGGGLGSTVSVLTTSNGVGGVVGEGLGSGLTHAWARDYQQTSLVGIGGRMLVHEAKRISGGGSDRRDSGGDEHRAAALCAVVLDDEAWDVAREELKALGALAHLAVMRVHGWYERRLAPTPLRAAAYEVCVAAQLMHGGDVLQRACARRYCEHDVRLLAIRVCEGLSAVDYAQIRHVDVAPWSLLYEVPAAKKLHEGLVLTNIAFAAPPDARAVDAPLRAAFDAPEVQAGAPREMATAMYTLGKVLELLLFGDARSEHTSAAREAANGGGASGGDEGEVAISKDAISAIEILCQPNAQARPRPHDALQLAWLHPQRGGAGGDAGDASDAPREDPAPADAPAAAEVGVVAGASAPPNISKLYGSSAAGGEAAAGGAARPAAAAHSSAENAEGAQPADLEQTAPLVGAHERLNRWYDDYLFEGMTHRLAKMADD